VIELHRPFEALQAWGTTLHAGVIVNFASAEQVGEFLNVEARALGRFELDLVGGDFKQRGRLGLTQRLTQAGESLASMKSRSAGFRTTAR